MLTGASTQIATHYLQVRPGGDIAALAGMCKAVLANSMTRPGPTALRVCSMHDFIAQHTHGFRGVCRLRAGPARGRSWRPKAGCRARTWLPQQACTRGPKAVMGIYGMGLTQHKLGVDNVRMLVNLLLMGGHIGRPGAGICPVRGHSNVQGQRTVGIAEKPELVPLDRLAALYGFEPPRAGRA
jgi:anaerobic selenocysteine-containing dehydrogenase